MKDIEHSSMYIVNKLRKENEKFKKQIKDLEENNKCIARERLIVLPTK